ncbi:Gfo/Idh/MocA family protein [Metabacillus malikii]|uniref:Dehydrogenase n=1 Tax=Metabacillus malikii TaxID=1504265 RepID=A0ABT9ZFY5_9BACI|nr:Gfo/Idh/MocA family oxidoreductase [Metabacillus malikii]MDQ0230706.1 putative dehydrogenase [Metabacillus malikii]
MGETINWGIMGTGWIAKQFTEDLTFANNGQAVAVGSRTLESAEKFASTHQIARAYGSYEELVQDKEIDAIYVATPHPFHKENVLTCLRAGKAVLCEKPFTMNASELEELVHYARENKLFLMEGMWTRFLPPIQKVNEWINSGKIGEVRLVKADFGFKMDWDPEHRLLNPNLGGGALLDAGIYPVSFAAMIFGANPEKIVSSSYIGETGVDEQFSIILQYPSGKTASLNGAVRVGLTNEAHIFGTNGHIHIPSFLNAKSATLHVNNEDPVTFTDDRESLGYAFEAEEVGRCILAGKTESSTISLNQSLGIMKILDEVRGQWGLTYPFE